MFMQTKPRTVPIPRTGPHLLTLSDMEPAAFHPVLDLAASTRSNRTAHAGALAGRTVVLIFEKPSLRTRVTFEVAIRHLGGHPLLLDNNGGRIGEREPARDLARSLSLWVDAVVVRTFAHRVLEEMSAFSAIPVINALSDYAHPCQALADLLTLRDVWPSFRGKQLVYVGDWNNVARSLHEGCQLAGVGFRAICPEAYGPEPAAAVDWSASPEDVRGADAVYTDVWTSMGSEHQMEERAEAFRGYQVNDWLMARTGKDALFMHCLPAHRGQEVTDSVLESPNSVVWQQAANRLPVEKAVLISLMEAYS